MNDTNIIKDLSDEPPSQIYSSKADNDTTGLCGASGVCERAVVFYYRPIIGRGLVIRGRPFSVLGNQE